MLNGRGRDEIDDFQTGSDLIQITRGSDRFDELEFIQVKDDVVVKFGKSSAVLRDASIEDIAVAENFDFV